MAIAWSSLVGGSGGGLGFKVVARFNSTIPVSTAVGNILVGAAVAENQVLRIRVLGTSASTAESNITLTVDGFDYITNGSLGALASNPVPTSLLVSPNLASGSASLQNVPLAYSEIVCKTFTLTKLSFSTTQIIAYSYEILEPIE